MKFTFKADVPTGRYRSFHPTTHHIKLNKKACGWFHEQYGKTDGIWLSIEKDEKHDDGNPNCSWMNIRLKAKFETVKEVKEFLIENTDAIVKKYNLHF